LRFAILALFVEIGGAGVGPDRAAEADLIAVEFALITALHNIIDRIVVPQREQTLPSDSAQIA
jgi:hypothetical protein